MGKPTYILRLPIIHPLDIQMVAIVRVSELLLIHLGRHELFSNQYISINKDRGNDLRSYDYLGQIHLDLPPHRSPPILGSV